MNKVLILTCSTGEGHNSAAHAIEIALQKHNIACEVRDPVSFQSDRMKHLVAGLYNNTIRKTPALFGAVYKIGDLYCSTKLPSPVYWANSHYAESLKAYILEHQFDAVICTHLYGMEAMTAIRKDNDFTIPCYGVLTDYVVIPFLEETDLTGFFVPSEDAKQYLISKGIDPERIIISGIPVKYNFADHPDKVTARKQLQLPEDKHLFLIMTGGVGCENMEQLCSKLLSDLTEDDLMIVLTGKNEELKQRLDKKYASNDKVKTVAFTDQVPAFMAASDVLLTKPGGLSSTEAAVANIPIVHIRAIPGCETFNAQFFSGHGMSCCADNDSEAVVFARMLAYDHQKAEQMRMEQRKYINPDAADLIVKEVDRACTIQN